MAGDSNTWMAGLIDVPPNGLEIAFGPKTVALRDVVDHCEQNQILGVAIDAQLSISIDDKKGLRESDRKLKRMLPKECGSYVMSFNSLMAVTVRGRLLADALSPIVGTILETHPRATLCLTLKPESLSFVKAYKPPTTQKNVSPETKILLRKQQETALESLAQDWLQLFKIRRVPVETDGALDAIVCATVAYLYHRQPDRLMHLPNPSKDRVGRGPFYVGRPDLVAGTAG